MCVCGTGVEISHAMVENRKLHGWKIFTLSSNNDLYVTEAKKF